MAINTQVAPNKQQKSWLQLDDHVLEPIFVGLTLLGIIAGLMLQQLDVPSSVMTIIAVTTYAFGSFYALRAIIEALRERTIEVDLLMVLAALGAAYIGAWTDGAMLLFLFALSNLLQNYAMDRTERAISSLLDLRPDTVLLRKGGDLVEVALEEAQVGDTVVLRPGDRAALDGLILQGSASFDEASITGESMPVSKSVGDLVFAGTVNQNGSLDIQVTKHASESTLARVINMVSEARERKARSQSFLDRFEQYYAVGVIGAVALFIALVPLAFGQPFNDVFYRAMVLLTVASPCALVISVPASFLSAIASGARHGVLFKGGAHLEALAKIKVVAFDKTGTLTYGKPEVKDVLPQAGVSERELLEVVARAEQPSEHPIARAIRAHAAQAGVAQREPEQFEAVTGMGIRARWDGRETLVGSAKLIDHAGLELPQSARADAEKLMQQGRGSVLLVWHGDRYLGLITVMDRLRADAKQQVAALREAGIERVVMLTGDNQVVAEAIAREVGVDEVHASLMPADKLRIVEELQGKHGPTAMVGDGVNDAPALAAASTGVAMGAAGTDVAMETADIVLMSDDLNALSYAVRLSKQAQRVVWQNIAFALAVVVVLVISTLTVGIALPIGVIGHEGSTILVVLNGLRLLRYR